MQQFSKQVKERNPNAEPGTIIAHNSNIANRRECIFSRVTCRSQFFRSQNQNGGVPGWQREYQIIKMGCFSIYLLVA